MPKMQRVFYAFPGQPTALGETIQTATESLRGHPDMRRSRTRFTCWNDMNIGGKQLVDTILQNIDRADVFACDLTYPNSNVSFELGYAIGKFKRVWVSLDPSIEGAEQNYRRTFYGLIGAGYKTYNNSNELADAFLQDNPTRDIDQTLLGPYFRSPVSREEEPVLLYVKPTIITDAVISTSGVIANSIFRNSIITDDPIENPNPTLEWYAGSLRRADAVLCHLLANNQTGHLEHNAKCSLVAGLARGFETTMLMLGQQPFDSPVDFRSLLFLHETANECKIAAGNWMDELKERIPRRRPRRPEGQTPSRQRLDLRSLAIGEPVAENERQRLDQYFLETSTYYRAMDDPVTIVVGRRGVGKSAQLFAMQAALTKDRRNHVCVVKPVGYEIDGLVRVLQSIGSKSERGYLVESLWKFLLYSEIAQSINSLIRSRPIYYEPTEAENRLVEYYDEHSEMLDPPFSERLDVALRSLADLEEIEDPLTQRRRISEILHSAQLRDLRGFLGETLASYEKVSILIDNLDGPWGANEHIEPLSELLWGLLQVSDDIVSQFRVNDHWRTAANVHMTVFLRSDIFAFIQPRAPEQDKLPIQRIIWDDSHVLKRLIDQRFEFGGTKSTNPQEVWAQLFPEDIVGYSPWEFVVHTVLPRHRDIVYLLREAIDGAINRGNGAVTTLDLLDAREKYSEYAFRSILAEDDPRKGNLEAILYEFAGCPKYIGRSEIESRFNAAGVDLGHYDFYVDLLCDVNFLAIASTDGYQYAKHEADREIKRKIAEQVARNANSEESYQVSSAFWQVLQIEQSMGTTG